MDGGDEVNLMPQFMLKMIGMFDTNVKHHNMVLSNYASKIGHTLGVVQVDLIVGLITRPTMFMAIQAKANYNLLLGLEWVNGIGPVPYSLHQRVSI